MKNDITRRGAIIKGTVGALALGCGLVARPAFSQKAAYYMPQALREWSDVPAVTLGKTAPQLQFAQHVEVSRLHTATDQRTPYTLLGRVFDAEKNVVEFAHLNVWQTDEAGQYIEEGYRGAVSADREGRFSVATVMPTAYHDAEGVLRAPHLHAAVFASRVSQQVFETEMFFSGDRVAKLVDPGFAAQNEIEFELQSDGSLLGYFNIFLA